MDLYVLSVFLSFPRLCMCFGLVQCLIFPATLLSSLIIKFLLIVIPRLLVLPAYTPNRDIISIKVTLGVICFAQFKLLKIKTNLLLYNCY